MLLPSGVRFLSSAGRDRLLHVFDCDQDYGLVQTLDDHSAAITAIRFTDDVETGQMKMISCGADKSILFRNAQMVRIEQYCILYPVCVYLYNLSY